MLEVDYVGNRTTRLNVNRELNFTPQQYLSRSPVRDPAAITFLSQTFPNPFFGLNPIFPRTITRANLFNPALSAEQHKSDVSPKIAEYARRPEVSGTDAQGRALGQSVRVDSFTFAMADARVTGRGSLQTGKGTGRAYEANRSLHCAASDPRRHPRSLAQTDAKDQRAPASHG